ncbi:LuxR C-terminal-related transcriptional regulator [Nocardioides bizhenqiangii]|uniref:LuxR C-terminal-related transcriptional regulator n=1 Tax=Nocardioides bizhenqiangii TaxID=3095076 RepID=A0ABZ0ZUX1_9ACTN|nr:MULTISPECIES: LuxR C-terminal-related transcriptional regulator [unclassified Nocardioides]MDZ5623053.1 LuxR C-terminal-related transcriptional regulator [Nocardioides sp. HM23]WQQ28032.1 LuxR C-terminal-related transcriptional regulator [Nocardioides sp. HM61]
MEGRPTPATWGWAVVEIRPDGSWGQPHVVQCPGPIDAAAAVAASPSTGSSLRGLSPTLRAHLGALHVASGGLHGAETVLARGAAAEAWSEARDDCRGALAHVEALRGELCRADRRGRQVQSAAASAVGAGIAHARLARAWVALERGQFAKARRRLAVISELLLVLEPSDQDLWMDTSRLLIEAKLLIATGQPEAATRLLADADLHGAPGPGEGWLRDLVKVAHAEALLAAGEPRRALASLTPLPPGAVAEATVVAAAARLSVRDLRGAQAVLSRAEVELEQAPLALQVEAWLLESRLAQDRGERDRACLVMDRALRSAAPQQMRRALVREWRWVRAFVDRDPALRPHRDFLATIHVDDDGTKRKANQGRASDLIGAPLTERETQVLDLLAQMYSTEEIAAALYVSANTVKTHLKGIFGKLCVNRRVEAVRRGRQLGLC